MHSFLLETSSATAGPPYLCFSRKIERKFLIEPDFGSFITFSSGFLVRQIMHKSTSDSVFLFFALIKKDLSIPKEKFIRRS